MGSSKETNDEQEGKCIAYHERVNASMQSGWRDLGEAVNPPRMLLEGQIAASVLAPVHCRVLPISGQKYLPHVLLPW